MHRVQRHRRRTFGGVPAACGRAVVADPFARAVERDGRRRARHLRSLRDAAKAARVRERPRHHRVAHARAVGVRDAHVGPAHGELHRERLVDLLLVGSRGDAGIDGTEIVVADAVGSDRIRQPRVRIFGDERGRRDDSPRECRHAVARQIRRCERRVARPDEGADVHRAPARPLELGHLAFARLARKAIGDLDDRVRVGRARCGDQRNCGLRQRQCLIARISHAPFLRPCTTTA